MNRIIYGNRIMFFFSIYACTAHDITAYWKIVAGKKALANQILFSNVTLSQILALYTVC